MTTVTGLITFASVINALLGGDSLFHRVFDLPHLGDQVGTEIPSFEGTRDRYFEKPGRVEELLSLVHEMLTGKK